MRYSVRQEEATVAGNNTDGSLLLPDWERIHNLALLTDDMIAAAAVAAAQLSPPLPLSPLFAPSTN